MNISIDDRYYMIRMTFIQSPSISGRDISPNRVGYFSGGAKIWNNTADRPEGSIKLYTARSITQRAKFLTRLVEKERQRWLKGTVIIESVPVSITSRNEP